MEPEQIEAELLRVMYRLGLIDYKTINRLIDELTVRLLTRTLKEET